MEYILCARHSSRSLGLISEQNQDHFSCEVTILARVVNKSFQICTSKPPVGKNWGYQIFLEWQWMWGET